LLTVQGGKANFELQPKLKKVNKMNTCEWSEAWYFFWSSRLHTQVNIGRIYLNLLRNGIARTTASWQRINLNDVRQSVIVIRVSSPLSQLRTRLNRNEICQKESFLIFMEFNAFHKSLAQLLFVKLDGIS
jgi:hypothetical protein